MALIIELNREVDIVQSFDRPATDPIEDPAEIILFPGIRYERWSEAECSVDETDQETEASTQRIYRDWLEI